MLVSVVVEMVAARSAPHVTSTSWNGSVDGTIKVTQVRGSCLVVARLGTTVTCHMTLNVVYCVREESRCQ